ncbi:MAG: hypothetical protein LBI81_01900 [Puniceicoccales bacterium]|jgi:hypothetical protein|nr:hypothetical protein [Puniceicoccales bacterium]
MNGVRMEFSSNAAASLAKIFPDVGEFSGAEDGKLNDVLSNGKIIFSVSSVQNDGNVIILRVSDVCPKRSLSERSAETLRGANNMQLVASVASLLEGIYKIYSGDKSAGMTFIASGLISILTIGKEYLVDICKK